VSADHQSMAIQSVTWHVAAGTIEFAMRSLEPPPRPEWIPEDRWYGGTTDVLIFTVPAKRATAAPATGIGVTGTNPDGTPQYTQYTWSGSAWINPVRVDGNGVPL
jgi:hypothetical protein